jgi:hypothetical protein
MLRRDVNKDGLLPLASFEHQVCSAVLAKVCLLILRLLMFNVLKGASKAFATDDFNIA